MGLSVEKRQNKACIKKASTWGTEVDCAAAGCGIIPKNPGVPKLNYPAIEIDDVANPFETDIDHANINPADFTLNFDAQYNGLEMVLLAALMGTSPAPQPNFVIDATNNIIDFKDTAAATKVATVASGSYTGTTLATAIAVAMNAAGGAGTFACSFSTSTLKFTINETSGPTNFELLWNTGTNKAVDISTVCGYSDAADDTGAATYTGDTAAPGSSSISLHTMTAADEVFGIFFSYAVEKKSKIHVVRTAKVTKMGMKLNGGLIGMDFSLRGDKVIDNSSTVAADMTAVTYPDIHGRMKFHQAVFRLNTQSGGALAVGDTVLPNNFTLEFERKVDSKHVAGSQTVIEPREEAKPSVKLTLEFPRMDTTNNAYFSSWTAGTEMKGDITFTGAVIAGTHTYLLTIQFPRLQIEDVEYSDGNIIPAKLVLRSVVADSAPTGMSITKPIGITLVNTRTTSLLA